MPMGGVERRWLRMVGEDAIVTAEDFATPISHSDVIAPVVRSASRPARSSAAVMLATAGVFAPPANTGPTDTAMLGYQPDRLNRAPLRTAGMRFETGTPPLPIGPTDQSMLAEFPDTAPGRPRRAAHVQFYAAPVFVPPTPSNFSMLGYFPARLNARPLRAPYMQFHIGAPPPYVPGPTDAAMLGYFPARLNDRPRIAARVPSFFWPLPFVLAPPFGPGGPVLVVTLEAGAVLAMEWATDILKAWDGSEYRTALLSGPRVSFKAAAHLVDGGELDVRSNLVKTAAQGSTFLLGLAHEEVTIVAPSLGTVANVASTALLDWVRVGQRAIAIGGDGTTVTAVVQAGATATQIPLDVPLGASAGAPGARLMPLVAVYLDAQQGFARYPVHLSMWSIAARQALFGLAGSDDMGLGVSITVGIGYSVWDRGLNATDPSTDSAQTLAELVDLGGLPTQRGSANSSDWGRHVKLVSSSLPDWQWVKRFLSNVRGRQLAFLLPTGRADVIVQSILGGNELIVKKSAGSGDVTQFLRFASGSHFGFAYTYADGSPTEYDQIFDWNDNGDGTVTLFMNVGPTHGTPAMVSWLELVRFESDRFEVTFDGGVFIFDVTARVVQQ